MGGFQRAKGVALIQNGHGDIELRKGKTKTTLTHNCHFKQTSLFVATIMLLASQPTTLKYTLVLKQVEDIMKG